MLRITVSKNGDGAVKYFTQSLSREDYYHEGKEVAGQWYGKGAALLGLMGNVDKKSFEYLVHNRKPDGTKLTPRDSKNRKSGYDFTFNAPKSLSLLYELTNDDEILKAHQEAVKFTLEAVEREGMQTQDGQGKGKTYKNTGNLIAAVFDHFTARPTDLDSPQQLKIPDMHLHTHAFVFSATYFEEKERFQAIELGNVKREASYYQALYHATLINKLKHHYDIERRGKKWEIKGISENMIKKFSRRTEEIEKAILKNGILDPKKKQNVGARTRQNKQSDLSLSELREIWMDRLSRSEVKEILAAKKRNKANVEKGSADQELKVERALNHAKEHWFERKTAVSEKRLLAEALTYDLGNIDPVLLKQVASKDKDFIRARVGGADLVTTQEMLEAEQRVISFANETRGIKSPIHTNYTPKASYLNEQQREAINHVLSSQDQITMVSGAAGTGKTTLFQEVKDAFEEKGERLFAFAPSANQSRGVLQDKGFKDATTISALLNDEKVQANIINASLLIDEAGMVSMKQMDQLITLAKDKDCRLILSGDWKQHHSVESGDAMRTLETRAGLPVARVNEIVRQNKNANYKKAIGFLSKGETLKGYKCLDDMGAIKQIEDQDKRYAHIVESYLESIERKESCLIVTPMHRDGCALTKKIRAGLKEKGQLDSKDIRFKTFRDLSLTNAQKADIRSFQKGQVIQFHKNAPGFKLGHKYEVQKIDNGSVYVREGLNDNLTPLPFDHTRRFQVYNKVETGITKGDILRISKNGKDPSGKPLRNGQVLKVSDITNDGQIKLDNGAIINKEFGNWALGYYSTSYSSQGRDAEKVIISQSSMSFAATNEQQFYVSSSRGCSTIEVVTDSKEDLELAIQRSAHRMSAHEMIEANEEYETGKRKTDYLEHQNKQNHGKENKAELPRVKHHGAQGQVQKSQTGPIQGK